jgi:hypothetical protein
MRQRENRGIIGNYQTVTSINASGIHSLVDAQQNRGNSSWPIAGIPNLVDILLVGGGAGGGIPGDGGSGGAGGGGGYVYYQQNLTFGAGTWTITVGAGGSPSSGFSNNGTLSSISGQGNTYSADGGIRNQSYAGPQSGGLSGQTINGVVTNYTGGSTYVSGGDCYSRAGGGGAGSGGNGGSASYATGGVGGVGYSSSISGASANYGGGGGAGAESTGGAGGAGGGGNGEGGTSNNATAGTANTGGGGGGAGGRCNVAGGVNGKSGGSGVVIIRYPNTFDNASSTTGSPTLTNTGGYKIYTFTGNGTLTFS